MLQRAVWQYLNNLKMCLPGNVAISFLDITLEVLPHVCTRSMCKDACSCLVSSKCPPQGGVAKAAVIPVFCGTFAVCYCAQVTMTKCHRQGGLNNRHLLAHSSGAEIKVLQGWFLLWLLSSSCRWLSPLRLLTVFPVCMCVCVSVP